MGKIQQTPCTGCTTCPIVAVRAKDLSPAPPKGSPLDLNDFTQAVNCLKGDKLPGLNWTMEDFERAAREQVAGRNSMLSPREQRFIDPLMRYPADAEMRHRYADEADRMFRRLEVTYPDLGPPWHRLLHSCGEHLDEHAQVKVLQFLWDVLRHYGAEGRRAEIRKTHQELLDLCNRVTKAFEHATDVEDLRVSIEELDSLVYEIEKESDG